jgi:DNA-binding CsgD family transcriptional regulator
MLENYRGSVRHELDEVEKIKRRPLTAIARLAKIRCDAVVTVTAVKAHGVHLLEPFPADEALESAAAMLKSVRQHFLKEAAQSLDRADFASLENRLEGLDEILDGLEAHAGGRIPLRRGVPSWTSLWEGFQGEVEKFELWALNIEGGETPEPLSDRERDVLACLSEQPLRAKEIAEQIGSTEQSVTNIISDLRDRRLPIPNRHGVGYFIDPNNQKIKDALANAAGDSAVIMG